MAAEDWIFEDPYESWDRSSDCYDNYASDTPREIIFTSIKHETEKAVLYETRKGLIWIPRSLITTTRNDKIITVPAWCSNSYFK